MCNESSKKNNCNIKENCKATNDTVLDYSEFKKTVGETTTNFSSRFMPNVKFKVPTELKSSFAQVFYYTTRNGSEYFPSTSKDTYYAADKKEVSIYEVFSELVPDGMTYDKESNSLEPIQDTYKGDPNAEFVNKDSFIKHDQEKPMYHLIDPFAYEDLAKLLTFGAKKYDADNWKKGDIKTYISALERHLSEIKKAVETKDYSLLTDKDSSLQHGAALMCNSMFIHHFVYKILLEEADTK